MKKLILLSTLLMNLIFAYDGLAASNEATILKAEYSRLDKLVATLTPDGKIGDFMNFKKIDNYEILWDLGPTPEDYSVISIFNEHSDGTDNFFVSYYLSKDIVPGTTVIRRFVGPLMSGWRNDTIDVHSEEYYGSQGQKEPVLSAEDLKLIKKLKIQLII